MINPIIAFRAGFASCCLPAGWEGRRGKEGEYLSKKGGDHFQVMKDMIIFQKSPTKLANKTWYCTGMNQKLMEEANGQIFQLLIIISWYLSLKIYTPFLQDWRLRSVTIWLIGKKKASRIGAKANWSIAIDPNTFTVFETLGKIAACTLGSSLQYHM